MFYPAMLKIFVNIIDVKKKNKRGLRTYSSETLANNSCVMIFFCETVRELTQ